MNKTKLDRIKQITGKLREIHDRNEGYKNIEDEFNSKQGGMEYWIERLESEMKAY